MSNYVRQVKDSAETQENLNPQQSVFPILVRSEESLVVEEGPTIVYSNDITNMAIWDNPQTTWDGVDTNDQWDSYSDSTKVIARVTNPRNMFIERFAFTTLRGANDTSTWDTTNKQVTIADTETFEIASLFKDSSATQTVTSITLTATESVAFPWEASADGGSNWESITNGTTHAFTNTGSDLRLRVVNTATGSFPLTFPITFSSGGVSGTVTVIKANYELS